MTQVVELTAFFFMQEASVELIAVAECSGVEEENHTDGGVINDYHVKIALFLDCQKCFFSFIIPKKGWKWTDKQIC